MAFMNFLEQYVENIADTIKKQKYIVDFVNTYKDLEDKYDVSNPEKLTISTGDTIRVLADENYNNEITDYILVKNSKEEYSFVKNSDFNINTATSSINGGIILNNTSGKFDEVMLNIDENNNGYANITEGLGDLDSIDLISKFNEGYNS